MAEKIARAEVLIGVYDNAHAPGQGFLSRLLRHKLALGALPQNVVPLTTEQKMLGADESEAEMFSVRFVAWRKLNMRVAGLAIFLRLILSLWILIERSNQKIAANSRRDCKEQIIWYGCECGIYGDDPDDPGVDECLLGPGTPSRCAQDDDGNVIWDGPAARLPSGLSSQELDIVVNAGGYCQKEYGVRASTAFPLIPDHIRSATEMFTLMGIGKDIVKFICQCLALFCLIAAGCRWYKYDESRRLLQYAFSLLIAPPFLMGICVPMRAGVDMKRLQIALCRDVVEKLTDVSGNWVLGMDLGDRETFCELEPEAWGEAIQDAIVSSGLSSEYNATLLAVTCPKAQVRKAGCKTECASCFGDVQRQALDSTGVNQTISVRNPCLDYLTFDQLCRGRDAVYEAEFRAYSYGDFSDTTVTVAAHSYTGGYNDRTSLCSLIATQFSNCSAQCDGVYPTGPGFNGEESCAQACDTVFKTELLGNALADADFAPSLCAGDALYKSVGSVTSIANTLFEAVEVGVGVAVGAQTVAQLLPMFLSIVKGLLKGAEVLNESLPWVRFPAFQMVISNSLIAALVAAIMSSFFQMGGDGWSASACVALVLSFAYAWPTPYFLSARSFLQTQKMMFWRKIYKLLMQVLCVALFLAWFLRSEFVQKMIEESGFMLIDKIVTNPQMLYDNIKAPLWVFVGAVLDFLGASVVSKMFYCDLLLDIVIKTELQDVTPQQDVMRGEVERLKKVDVPMVKSKGIVSPSIRLSSTTGEIEEVKATAVSPVVLHSKIASNIAAARQAKQAAPDAVPGAARQAKQASPDASPGAVTMPARAAVQAEGTRDVLKVVSTGAVVSVGKEASPSPRPAPPPNGTAPSQASPEEAAADGGNGGVAPGKHRRRRHRQTPERLEREDDERFLKRMETRDEAEAVAGAASFIGEPKPAHVIASGPLPRLTEDQVVEAMDEYTVKLGAKALFERINANRSGRVDAHELSEALRRMKVGVFEEAETLEFIKAINRRHGSRRDSLAFDVFAVAFSSKVANAKQAPLPSQASHQQASPSPVPANVIEFVLEAIQRQVDQLGTRAVFDVMDADRSGRVSADELVGALAKLKMAQLAMDGATAEELILRINARHGSKRKSLTFDIFAVAFAKGAVHGEGSRQTQGQQQQLSPLPPSADKLKQQSPSPSPVTAEQAMIAMLDIVARTGVKATFDMLDANRSGNVSAGELARALRRLHVVMEEASAQELIFSINARHGSKRKFLTFDIFAVAFGAKSSSRV